MWDSWFLKKSNLKFLTLILIRFYQAFFPKKYRGKCIFKESCSNYVYREIKENGFISGLKAFKFRYENCRPDYKIINHRNMKLLISSKNLVFEESEIDARLLL
jgi:uncharacterized protein